MLSGSIQALPVFSVIGITLFGCVITTSCKLKSTSEGVALRCYSLTFLVGRHLTIHVGIV